MSQTQSQENKIEQAVHALQVGLAKLKASYWPFAPANQSFFVESVKLICVAVVQNQVLPQNGWGVIDLVTPWLVGVIIICPLFFQLGMIGIASLLQQIHSSWPTGFWPVFYLILCTFILMLRDYIAWRRRFAWVIAVLLAMSLKTFLLTLVLLTKQKPHLLGFDFYIRHFSSGFIFVGVALYIFWVRGHFARQIHYKDLHDKDPRL